MNQFRADGSRHGDSHGCETIGNDAGIRLIAVIMARDPHLVSTYIRNHNVFPSHDLAHIV